MCHRLAPIALLLACLPSAPAAPPAPMQAAVVAGARLQLREVPRPLAGPGQVLVRLEYAGVNPLDWKAAGGGSDDPSQPSSAVACGAIPGVDGAGVIVAIGSGIRGYRPGDPVMLWSRHCGTYAQYVAVAADAILRKPARLSFAQAAALPHASLAAWNMLVDQAQVHAGQSVLVLGGAGGVGSAAVQIAHRRGARVTATTSAHNRDYVLGLGADTAIDYAAEHFEDTLRDVDVVINTVDLDNAYRALSVVRRGGVLVSTVGVPQPAQCAARGVTCLRRSYGEAPVAAALSAIAAWADSGEYRVDIDRRFELGAALAAWQYSQAGHTRGKAVIRIPP